MSTPRPFRHRLAVLAVLPLASGLVACGSDGDDDSGDSGDSGDAAQPSSTVTVTEEPETSPSPSEEGTTSGGGDNGDGNSDGADDGALEAAAETALGEVSGATLVTIDLDDSGWDVTLVSQDGTESDLDVSADGTSVTDTTDNDDNDADDRAEQQRLLDARVDYLAAVETARGEVPQLQVTGADLEEDDGTLRWDVDLGDGTDDDQRTVRIDAASGDVIGTERDNNDDNDD